MYKYIALPFTILFLLILSGCGYHMGSFANPQIKTIAISPIINDTQQLNAGGQMKQALVDRFHFDGSYKIVNIADADAIIYGRISEISFTAPSILTSDEGVTFMTKVFGCDLTFEYTLIVPGRATTVVSQTTVTGNSQFQVPVDLFPARQSGVAQSARDAAEEVVWRCTEGW
jgi:hypothetical protein